jgi:hypothetical protein
VEERVLRSGATKSIERKKFTDMKKKTLNSKSRTQRLFETLARGTKLSSKQIENRFDLANPSAIINDLRKAGHRIAFNDGKYGMPVKAKQNAS